MESVSLAHIWSRKLMLIVAALVGGSFWSWLYKHQKSLLPGVISHFVWSTLIFLVFPINWFRGGPWLVRGNKDATREKIIAAAVRVFSDKGYHGATVDDVVAASGTSKGAFYFHFPSKQEMFMALVDEMARLLWEALREVLEGEGDAASKMERAFAAGLRVFEENRELAKIALVEAAALGPEVEEKRMRVRQSFVGIIEDYLKQMVAEGDIQAIDTRVAALALFGTINEVVIHWLATGEPASLREAAGTLALYNMRGIGLKRRVEAR